MVTFDFKKTPITQIADYIIMYSAKSDASDIHFDPRDNGLMVRIRVDGELQDYTLIPPEYQKNLTTRLKLLANMNITESRLPQDGSIKGTFGKLYLDMRVSCLPTNEGEKIVIRILDYSRSLEGLESLGFSKENFVKLKRMISVPNGIILVTGATGSGKSTTTYSILQELNKPETNIITVEDPVEMNIEGLNQVQVNSEIGLDFATVLRSILRQDPNIILIGEIRDSETARIAVRASITGHFVLSTIHTNDSLSTIERLLDMDVEKYLLSSALTGIISQRLAKKLCPKCRKKKIATKYEQKVYKIILNKEITELYEANNDGCDDCHKGYKGRIAIQEVLEIDDQIRDALNDDFLSKEDMRKMVYTSNVITMLQDGLLKVLDGSTSFDEIYRIIEIDENDLKEKETINNNTNSDISSNTESVIDNVEKNIDSTASNISNSQAKSIIKDTSNLNSTIITPPSIPILSNNSDIISTQNDKVESILNVSSNNNINNSSKDDSIENTNNESSTPSIEMVDNSSDVPSIENTDNDSSTPSIEVVNNNSDVPSIENTNNESSTPSIEMVDNSSDVPSIENTNNDSSTPSIEVVNNNSNETTDNKTEDDSNKAVDNSTKNDSLANFTSKF